LKNKSCST